MAIHLTCPGCRTAYELEDSDRGEAVECECGAQFVVGEDGPVALTDDSPSASVPPAPEPPDAPGGTIAVVCPACGESYDVEPEWLGEPVECECGREFTATAAPPTPATPAARNESSAESAAPEPSPPPTGVEAEPTELVPDEPRPASRPVPRRRRASNPFVMPGILLGIVVVAVVVYVRWPDEAGESRNAHAGKDTTSGETVAKSDLPDDVLPDTDPADSPSDLNDGKPAEPPAAVDPADDPGTDDPTGTGSSNPNDLTDPNEFVIGSTDDPATPGEGPNTTKPADPPDDGMPEERTATTPPDPPRPAGIAFVAFAPPENVPAGLEKVVEKALAAQRKLDEVESKVGRSDPEWARQLGVTGGWLRTANAMLRPDSDPRTVARVRLLLAKASHEAGRPLEAALLGIAVAESTPDDLFVEEEKPSRGDPKEKPKPKPMEPASAGAAIIARETAGGTKPKENPKVDPTNPGKSATFIALAALVAAYDAAPADERDVERRGIVRLAGILDRRWPDDSQADAIRLHAGELNRLDERPEEAIRWYGKVSRKSEHYAKARLLAGQSSSALAESRNDDAERERAARLLQQGIDAAGDDAALVDNVAIARFTLARQYERTMDHERVVELLTTGSPAVTSVVAATGPRPPRGVRSPAFARLVYATLVRAQLKVGRIEDARTTLASIAEIATDDPALMATLSLDLAREMAQSNTEGDAALTSTVSATLAGVAKEVDALPTKSLLSAAETATKAANGLAPDSPEAKSLHGHAVTFYGALLDRGLPTPESERAVRYRLVASLVVAGEAERAVGMYDELLAAQPNVFDAQFAAAGALLTWGRSAGSVETLVAAIDGPGDKPHLWGFAKLSSIYQQLFTRDESRTDYHERFLDCRHGVARVRLAIASLREGEAQTAELEKALRELRVLALQAGEYEGPGWQRLDAVYRAVQEELGREPTSLFAE